MRHDLLLSVSVLSLGSLALAGCGSPAESPAPQTQWAVSVGGPDSTAMGVAVAGFQDGSSLLVGTHDVGVTLGRGEPAEKIVSASVGGGLFVGRYEKDGRLRWGRSAAGTSFVVPTGSAVLADESLVVVGYFEGSAGFEDGLGGTSTLDSAGVDDAFVVHYAGDGTLIRALSFGSEGYDEALGVAAAADGSFAVSGLFMGVVVLDAGEPGESVLVAGGEGVIDAFVARFLPGGSLLWARQTESVGYATGWVVGCTSDGGVVVAGEVAGSVTLGAGEPHETTFDSEGGSDDVWVARYGPAGDLAWARRIGGPGADEVLSLGTAPDGSMRIAGYIDADTVFGEGQPGALALACSGAMDGFVGAFDALGTPLWAHALGGTGDDYAAGVAVLPDGSAVVTGAFQGLADFDGTGAAAPLSTLDPLDVGGDAFAARYLSDGALLWARVAGGAGADGGIAVRALPGASSLVLAGFFTGTAGFDDPDVDPLSAVGAQDAFFARLSAD